MNRAATEFARPSSGNKLAWLGLVAAGAVALFVLGWGAARFTDAYLERQSLKSRTRPVDASNLRQIGQSALIWANEHGGMLPPVELDSNGVPDGSTLATSHNVAAALAREGWLNDSSMWFSKSDAAVSTATPSVQPGNSVLDPSRTRIDAAFAAEPAISWEFVTGLDDTLPAATPLAWTRGLRSDGTWDRAGGVYGVAGGYIVFLGGNVQFYRDLKSTPLRRSDGTPTSNILETLPTTARVVGAGPATLHGAVSIDSR